MSLGLPRHLRTLARRQEPADGAVEVPGGAGRARCSSCGASDPCISLYPEATYTAMTTRGARGAEPVLAAGARAQAAASTRNATDMELDSAGRVMLTAAPPRARGHRPRGRHHRRRRLPRALGPRGLGGLRPRPDRSGRLTSPHLLAILLDMPRTHVPVLAGELIEALDPQPGPDRGRLHARRRRPRAAGRRPARRRRAC